MCQITFKWVCYFEVLLASSFGHTVSPDHEDRCAYTTTYSDILYDIQLTILSGNFRANSHPVKKKKVFKTISSWITTWQMAGENTF